MANYFLFPVCWKNTQKNLKYQFFKYFKIALFPAHKFFKVMKIKFKLKLVLLSSFFFEIQWNFVLFFLSYQMDSYKKINK